MSPRRDRVAAATAALLLLTAECAAGCAPSRSGSLGPAPTVASAATTGAASTGPATTAPPAETTPPTATGPGSAPPRAGPSPTARPATLTLQLWYVRDGRLAPTRRTLPTTPATSRLALAELAAGPTRTEADAGLVTLLPDGAQVSRIAAGTATVRLPDAPDPATARLREAQVVYTLTQFVTVLRVDFGTAAPAGRAEYADLLPPVVIAEPVIGARVSSPITVSGSADVFEATVNVRLLDAAGRPLATGFTTATCGTGCRGGYRLTLSYFSAREQPGTVEAYEVSAADGSRTKLVAVPVTVAATR
ncbi:Gmad2 immunoglobulin-like domain-containing protein [Micromonospora sp. NPDC049903]|uniref:Gmad2 immunoglobulin-like domain-containing protein n=1 Tax=Micromonospora sp. NPDC049903 TaxID=3364276 RepID=UPI0037A3A489